MKDMWKNVRNAENKKTPEGGQQALRGYHKEAGDTQKKVVK